MSDSGKEDNVFGLMPSKKRKWPKWVGLGAAGILALGLGNHYTGDRVGLEKKVKQLVGISTVEKIPANQYAGEVSVASRNYFEMGGVEYVLNDYDAKQLEGIGGITVIANSALDKPDLRVVDKITKTGADKKEPALYERLYSVSYNDSLAPSLEERQNIPLLRPKYNQAEIWQKSEYDKTRVFGKINTAEKYIEVLDNGEAVGKVLVTDMADYVAFQLKKHGESEPYMFFINRRETVDWQTRKKTKELFDADIFWVEKTNR